MVSKSKIQIEVDASQFEDLRAKFDRYKTELEKTPDAWRAVAMAQEAVREGFAQGAQDAEQMAGHAVAVLDNSVKLDRITASTARHWKELARNTASVAGNIASATKSLLKWTGITSVIGGLVGGGSLFAMDRLADSVAGQRTQSMGLGTTYGGLSAFRTQFRRLGDPEGFLGNVSNALADPNQRGIFQQLGVSTEGDTADVATRAILRLKDTVDNIPKNQLALGLETRRLDKLISVETAKVLQGMSRDEVAGLAAGVGPLRKKLDLTPADQLKWQEFSTQIERATHVIGNAFTSRLVALADPLTHLSTSFVKLLDVMLKQGGPVEHWIGEFADGLGWLAKNIDSPDVRKEISHWKDEIVHISQSAWALGKSVAMFADKFASLLGVSPAAASTGGQQGASGGYSGRSGPGHGRAALGHRGDAGGSEEYGGPAPSGSQQGASGPVPTMPQRGQQGYSGRPSGRPSGGHGRAALGRGKAGELHHWGSGASENSIGKGSWWTPERQKYAYDYLKTKVGLSEWGAAGLVARWAWVESKNRGPGDVNSVGGGHWGIAQWSHSRAGDLFGNPDFDAQLSLAGRELDTNEAAAGKVLRAATGPEAAARGASMYERAEHYNPSTGYDDWTQRTPVSDVYKKMHKTKITVSTNTGGNVNTTAAIAAAH